MRRAWTGRLRRVSRRLAAAGLAAGTIWAVTVTAGSDTASAAWDALRAASPLAALKWELGDLWPDDGLSPAAVMTLGGVPPAALRPGGGGGAVEHGPGGGPRRPEEPVTEPVEETPLEPEGAADNGVPRPDPGAHGPQRLHRLRPGVHLQLHGPRPLGGGADGAL